MIIEIILHLVAKTDILKGEKYEVFSVPLLRTDVS
jgi:hypothetical protein